MMKPHYYRTQAEECRLAAGMLLGLAVASALASLAVWWSLGAGMGLLACVSVAIACLLGFFHEKAEALRLDFRAAEETEFNRHES